MSTASVAGIVSEMTSCSLMPGATSEYHGDGILWLSPRSAVGSQLSATGIPDGEPKVRRRIDDAFRSCCVVCPVRPIADGSERPSPDAGRVRFLQVLRRVRDGRI